MYRNGFGKTLLVLLASFLLSACATEAGYRKICESWMGAPCDKLVRNWGPPEDIMRLDDGSRLYVYENSAFVYMGITGMGGTMWCETQFECNTEGRIVDWRFKGNNCVAKYKEEPKPKQQPEPKIELGEGDVLFRRDVVNSVIAHYNSHGMKYSEKTLADSIRVAEGFIEIEEKGLTEEYFKWLKKQPEYRPELAELNYLLVECVKRHLDHQQEKEKR